MKMDRVYVMQSVKDLKRAYCVCVRGEWVILSRRTFFLEFYFRGTQTSPPPNFHVFLNVFSDLKISDG